jgi:hypothetical protein
MGSIRHRPRQVASQKETWIYYDLVLAARRVQNRAELWEASVGRNAAQTRAPTAARAQSLPATKAATGSDDSGVPG